MIGGIGLLLRREFGVGVDDHVVAVPPADRSLANCAGQVTFRQVTFRRLLCPDDNVPFCPG